MKTLANCINENFKLGKHTNPEQKDPILANMTFIEDDETFDYYFEPCRLRDIESEIDNAVTYTLQTNTMRLSKSEWEEYDKLINLLKTYTIYDCEDDDSVYEIVNKLKLKENFVFYEYTDSEDSVIVKYYVSDKCVVVIILNDLNDTFKYYFATK